VKFGAVSQRLSIDTTGSFRYYRSWTLPWGGPESVRVTQEVLL